VSTTYKHELHYLSEQLKANLFVIYKAIIEVCRWWRYVWL